jgi:hypothetical protein
MVMAVANVLVNGGTLENAVFQLVEGPADMARETVLVGGGKG